MSPDLHSDILERRKHIQLGEKARLQFQKIMANCDEKVLIIINKWKMNDVLLAKSTRVLY
jgi:hypothetical protein